MWWSWFDELRARDHETNSHEADTPEPPGHRSTPSRMTELQRTIGNRSVQRMMADSTGEPSGSAKMPASGTGGEPLPHDTRKSMETKFGAEFGHVRVHTGPAAAESARALQASAYTAGRNIYFAPGKYAPETPEGQRLLAHELVHTLQQGKPGDGHASKVSDGEITPAEHPLEKEANRLAAHRDGTTPVVPQVSPAAGVGIQRQTHHKEAEEAEKARREREEAAHKVSVRRSQAEGFVRDEVGRLGLPHSLLDTVQDLAHLALEHGPGEALNALARDTRIDAKLKERIRLILRGVLKYK